MVYYHEHFDESVKKDCVLPAFASAPPQVRVLVEGRWGTGYNLKQTEKVNFTRFQLKVFFHGFSQSESVCPQKGNMNVAATAKVVLPK